MALGSRWTPPAWGQSPSPIVKPLPPEWFVRQGTNAEMRWEAMRDQRLLVPNERFFVRNHTATPRIDPATWRLRVFGSGLRRPEGIALGYEDLARLETRELTAAIECAGNGRRFSDCLDATVTADGADQGHVRRPLPIGKALDDALLAFEMNGEELPPDHGFPARLVVPGWIGIASIKWVGSFEVSRTRLTSPWNTRWYRMTGPSYPPDSPPLTEQPWLARPTGRGSCSPTRCRSTTTATSSGPWCGTPCA